MDKKILVTAANGQLGSEIAELASEFAEFDFTFLNRAILDLSDLEAVETYFTHNRFDVIINTAAYTAVDKAEEDTEAAKAINTDAVKRLAEIAKEGKIQLIHISTDYVFDGKNYKPYIETDQTDPQGVYGQTKLAGEEAILSIDPANSAIIRTSWLYSSYGSNFVKTMLHLGEERDELGVIFDQVGTPTYAKDLAWVILENIQNSKLTKGNTLGCKIQNCALYHYSNEGVCSWYDFAKTIFELSNINCKVNAIETKEYPTPAKRPHYSVLNKVKIKNELGTSIPYWKDSLRECLKKINNKDKE
ncbi:MAG: dTDP-4-dehydrorhamnose reductase [Campylobacterota bacterium]|nr:dTDP-4-dehydrorhamnose reductase [Campylobacterota bacterium]